MKKLFYLLCVAVISAISFASCSSFESDEEQAKEKFKKDQQDAPAPPVIKPVSPPKKKKQADAGNSAEKAEKTPNYTSGTTKVDSGLAISVTTIGNNNKFSLTVNSGQGSSGSSTVGSETTPQLWEPFMFPGEVPAEPEKTTPSINLKKQGTVVSKGVAVITRGGFW